MNPEAATSRYFTLKDDKSNKFWQITVADSSYTVTFGRIGTAGRSQQKSFDTAARCSQETEKIIREKVAKGYAEESGTVPEGPPAVRRGPTDTGSEGGRQSAEATLAAFQELIDRKLPAELLPFLHALDRAHLPALRKAVKAARKYYCEFVELEERKVPAHFPNRWGTRGTDEQRCIIELSGLALLPAAELRSFNLLFYLYDPKWDRLVDGILDWARPAWLGGYLLDESRSNDWGTISYELLRRFQARGYVGYNPELAARSIAHCRVRTSGDSFAGVAEQYIADICNDELAYSRDFPLLFEYETGMHLPCYSIQPAAIGPLSQVSTWGSIIRRLLDDGKIDRLWLLESCITVQSKDWNANLRSFFRKQVDEMAPTAAELLRHQHSLYQLLGTQHPHVVNWAVGLIRDIAASKEFDRTALLEWAPLVMMRSDCKTAVKSLLSLLEKELKQGRGAGNDEILSIAADVFAQPDLGLQTKAAALIRKYSAAGDGELREKLRLYSEQMLGTVRQELEGLLTTGAADDELATTGALPDYRFRPAAPPLLSELREVRLPQSWNDWLFAVGTYIGSDEVLDMEILLNACILPPDDAPADGEQLQPYLKQLAAGAASYIKAYTNNWLLDVLQEPAKIFDQHRAQGEYETLRLQVARLRHAQRKIHARSKLPLLSLPSHAPHYIAPVVLVQRLIDYQQAGEPVDTLDLSIALARTLTDGAAAAIGLAAQLKGPLRNLVTYALTGEGEPAPRKAGGFMNTIGRGLGLVKEEAAPDLEPVYITAARTRNPDGVFDSLGASRFGDRPNVVRPFSPAWQLTERWNEYIDWRTKEKTRSPSWKELQVPLPDTSHKGSALLYSNDLAEQEKTFYWWYGRLESGYDVSWWHSIVFQMPESLFTLLLKCGCGTSELTGAATNGLRLMLNRHFRFREASGMLLACGLVASKREDRGLAAEVLIQHMTEQSIDPVAAGRQIGALLREGYAPLQRLTESLQLVRDVSPLHNKALAILTEEVILAFGLLTEPPKNTKKLLELYLDVLVKTGGSAGSDVLFVLERWPSPTLKPLINSLSRPGAPASI